MSRVKGHELQAEGAPFVVDQGGRVARNGSWQTVSGMGRGYCECGELGPIAYTAADRKRWHRMHKSELASKPSDPSMKEA